MSPLYSHLHALLWIEDHCQPMVELFCLATIHDKEGVFVGEFVGVFIMDEWEDCNLILSLSIATKTKIEGRYPKNASIWMVGPKRNLTVYIRMVVKKYSSGTNRFFGPNRVVRFILPR